MQPERLYKTIENRKINEKIALISACGDELPGIIVIHDVRDFSIVYMSTRGLQELDMDLNKVRDLSRAEWHDKYLNPDDVQFYAPKIEQLLEMNDMEKSISFFQQVKIPSRDEWSWNLCSMKIFMRGDDGQPLLAITISVPIEPFNPLSSKVDRMVKENDFSESHKYEFSKLGKREREVLKLTALGKSAAEIADELFISIETVNTHKKNIKQKLGTNSYFELCQYARAFDII